MGTAGIDRCIKMNIGSSKSILGYGGRFDEVEGSSLFSWGSWVVRCRGVIRF